MDVMLGACNLEIEVQAENHSEAIEKLYAFLLGLYAKGTSPTISPFVATHSINAYSGINSRDSELLQKELPEKMRDGLRSSDATVEAWPVQLSFSCVVLSDRLTVSSETIRSAAEMANTWCALEAVHPPLKVVRDAAQAAPLVASRDQSLLHLWCAVEAMFPKVSSEVSFRIALYLAQLATGDREDLYKRAKDAYGLRSRVAHGSSRAVDHEDWVACWDLLMGSVRAVVTRGELPTEERLLSELLSGNGRLPG
ncbi:MAG: hypothetical protein ACYC8T_33135 [Myxococcaceae bacterium]